MRLKRLMYLVVVLIATIGRLTQHRQEEQPEASLWNGLPQHAETWTGNRIARR